MLVKVQGGGGAGEKLLALLDEYMSFYRLHKFLQGNIYNYLQVKMKLKFFGSF